MALTPSKEGLKEACLQELSLKKTAVPDGCKGTDLERLLWEEATFGLQDLAKMLKCGFVFEGDIEAVAEDEHEVPGKKGILQATNILSELQQHFVFALPTDITFVPKISGGCSKVDQNAGAIVGVLTCCTWT